MIRVSDYIHRFHVLFGNDGQEVPWQITANLTSILRARLATLGSEYVINGDVAVHRLARVNASAMITGPAILSANCFVGPHALLRGGTFLDDEVSVGPGCEIKCSCIFAGSAVAHFNFVGDSILGSRVNLEAGAVIANHYNERSDRLITVTVGGQTYHTGVDKFGALIGDETKIGANAVLSPGTVLPGKSIVKRLELIDQSTGRT
jgi:bifunctional N-acetylglucosamine-1-phosphate-uridyltransferase/glucosamine-1-phosphate-acetyltransferase GlmU-like protein